MRRKKKNSFDAISLGRIFLLVFFFSAFTAVFAGTKKTVDSAYIEYHANGKIKITGQYREGERHGKWKQYDENGVMVKMTKYKKGEFIWERLYKNGRLTQTTNRKGKVIHTKDCGC